MIRMTVQNMVVATGASLVAGDPEVVFEGVGIDSRAVPAGGAFVAFVGERVDGNQFAYSAFEAGANVVVLTASPTKEVLQRAQEPGVALVRAANDDGTAFLLSLARAWRELNPQWTVVGVTGSVGKTTTKEMLAAGLGACRRTHATAGNFNSLLGVPLTLFAASPEDEVLVVEMGMNNAGELSRISAAVQPSVAVITNVGTSHIGNLGSREGIARAKAEVVGGMRAKDGVGPTLVLTDGDDYSDFIQREFCEPAGVETLRVGGRDCLVRATSVTLDEDGLPTVKIEVGKEMLAGTLSLPGKAMVYDLLSAMGAVYALGMPCKESFEAICKMKAAHMRLEVGVAKSGARVIDDSYNASPSSMAAALDVLCSMKCEGRRIAVLGEIGELGDQASRLHELVGAYAAAKPLDMLVVIGSQNARQMAQAACTMGFSEDKLESFANADDAATTIAPLLGQGDLVLVKASRAAGLDKFAKEVLDA